MNVLVIGSGGREHAIIKSLSESTMIKKLFASPGNAGTSEDAENVKLDLKNHQGVVQFCKIQNIEFVFIGPEDPLVDGLCDSLRKEDILVVGPSKIAAQLEGSKIFAKEFMKRAHIPTADATIVDSIEKTLEAAKSHQPPYILKADGLAAGKGVFICKNLDELHKAAQQIFNDKILGAAGEKALLEKNLPGTELSFLLLTNGQDFQALPLAQDHKRLLDGNQGPNTGGMGTVAPLEIPKDLYQKIIDRVIAPSVQQLNKESLLFRGVLFVGLMIVDNEPYTLEYNVRFGDPETQVILPLIENDLAKVFYKLAQGELEKLTFKKASAYCLVNAAEGYPDHPNKDIPIDIPTSFDDNTYVLHAGTKKNIEGRILSSGGRVLNVVAIADDYKKAKEKALALNERIVFKGRQYRKDIGDYQFQRQAT